jgi:hypothetical protein
LEHAESKITEANKEIAAVRDQQANKIAALEMKIKAQAQEITSLKRDLAIKVRTRPCLSACIIVIRPSYLTSATLRVGRQRQ